MRPSAEQHRILARTDRPPAEFQLSNVQSAQFKNQRIVATPLGLLPAPRAWASVDVGPELQKLLLHLAGEQFLRGNDSKGFCQRAAHYFGEINALHPFREGNGRAQREFIRELAAEAGYEIAWDLVTQDEMFTASVASFHGGTSEAFATILNKTIRPVR